jgi:hypothetical protein
MMKSGFTTKDLLTLGAFAFGAFFTYKVYKDASTALDNAAAEGKKIITTKLNPASDQNIIYKNVVGSVGQIASGDPNWTFGSWLYDLTHPNAAAYDPNAKPGQPGYIGNK